MIRPTHPVLLAVLFLTMSQAQAQDEKSLTRDEVAVFKKKLLTIFESLGQPPSGYSMERESYNLPTEAYLTSGSSRYRPTDANASREFGSTKGEKDASKEFEAEYKKKILEAQAKGDYEAMGKLVQEMQMKASELSLKTEEQHKEPISVNLALNTGSGETIDPDAVVYEQSGVIALKALNATPERGEVRIYFDPKALKETKQLSKVTLNYPEDGVAKRTTVLNATISFYGPAADIEAWAKRIDLKKVLSQLDH